MPKFQYSGRDNTGALVSGSLDAASPEEVASRLFGQSVTPIEITETTRDSTRRVKPKRSKRPGLEPSASAVDRINHFLGANNIETDDLIMFARQMQSLTKAGLPLDRAIKGLEASLTNKGFKAVLRDVVEGLENGQTLATALGQYPSVFSNLFLSLVHVGENTGRLDLAFKEVGTYLELEKNTTKQVKSATRYPIFVVVAIAIALALDYITNSYVGDLDPGETVIENGELVDVEINVFEGVTNRLQDGDADDSNDTDRPLITSAPDPEGDDEFSGQAMVEFDLGAATLDTSLEFLSYDWRGDAAEDPMDPYDEIPDGDYSDFPRGVVEFGSYRGHDRVINWQELFITD